MKEPIEEQVAARHLTGEQLSGRTIYPGHIVADLAAVVDECRAMRAERGLNLNKTTVMQRIGHLRTHLEQAHDAQDAESHLERLVLVAQMQILDALRVNIEALENE